MAVVVREGDPRAAIAVAVLTAGAFDAAGPRVPVALAAVTEARLAAAGLTDVSVAATWDGYRVRALLPAGAGGGAGSGGSAGAAATVRALREALVTPIGTGPLRVSAANELLVANDKLAALARRPLHERGLEELARCTLAPFSLDSLDAVDARAPTAPLTVETLEGWRAAIHGLGRVVLGATGAAHDVDAVTAALLDQPGWPQAVPVPAFVPRPSPPLHVYDATADLAGAFGARIAVVVHTPFPLTASLAANDLAAPHGPFASQLRMLETPVVVRDVTATANAAGGCLGLTLDLPRSDARSDDAIANAVALAQREARLAVAAAARRSSARARAGADGRPGEAAEDPRVAAELAAWWTLVPGSSGGDTRTHDAVFVGMTHENGGSVTTSLVAAVARASAEALSLAVDARRAVEPGQGALSMLLASTCGTLGEGDVDAGLTALTVAAVVEQARETQDAKGETELTEWITSEGVGVRLRASPREGEPPLELASRAADALGEAMFARPVTAGAIDRARAGLMSASGDDMARGFGALAEAVVPGHPSWTFPAAPGKGLEAWSEGAVQARLAALRAEPLRLAVIANDAAAQGDAAVLAVDRWVSHAATAHRQCQASTPVPARPGTYAAPPSTSSSAWLALPLPRGSAPDLRAHAVLLAGALDGPDGLLAHALGHGLASSWSARVVGPSAASTLVVRVESTGATLDGAVAQVRALMDRLHRGAFTDADRARAMARMSEQGLRESLAAQGRLVQLWRGDQKPRPAVSLDAVKAFLNDVVRDEALVIVASRPALARGAP